MSTKTDAAPSATVEDVEQIVAFTPEEKAKYQQIIEDMGSVSPEQKAKFQQFLEDMGGVAVSSAVADQTAAAPSAMDTEPSPATSLQRSGERLAAALAPPPPENDEPETLVILGRDKDLKQAARTLADKELKHDTHNKEQGVVKGFIKRIWKGKGATLHENYRQKSIQKWEDRMTTKQEIQLGLDGKPIDGSDEASLSLLKRFRSGPGYIDADVGETRAELGRDSVLGKGMRELIETASKRGAKDEWTNEKILEKYAEIVEADRLLGDKGELVGGAKMTSTDILLVINAYRGRGLHDEALAHTVQNMRIVVGESRSGPRTETNYTAADKLIEYLGKKKFIGKLVPEATISAVVTGGFTLANLGRGTVSRFLAPGVLGGAVGFFRGRKGARDEVAEIRSRYELGENLDEIFAGNEKRQHKLKDMMYPSELASAITKDLLAAIDDETLDSGGEDALQKALRLTAEAKVRRDFTNRKDPKERKPLIRYTDELSVDDEKIALREAEAAAGMKLLTRLQGLDDAVRTRLGVVLAESERRQPDGSVVKVPHINLEAYETPLRQEFNAKIVEADKVARKLVLGRAAFGAVIGAAASIGMSTLLQEAAHTVQDHFGTSRSSNLNLNTNTNTVGNYAPQGNAANHISINGGGTYVEDPTNHTFTVKGADGHDIVSGLKQGPDGAFDQASLDKLRAANIRVDTIHHPAVFETKNVSIDQYIKDHPGEFKQLQTTYMDNYTAKYDFNEQGGRLSFNPDGTLTIGQAMTVNGSSGHGMSLNMVDYQQTNKLDIAFRQPDGTFIHKTFDYGKPIEEPWASMFYKKSDGTAGFSGNGEVHWGRESNGVFYSAASLPGDGQSLEIPSQVLKTPEYFENKLTIPTAGPGHDIVPVVVAAVGRKDIAAERAVIPERRRPYYRGREYGSRAAEQELRALRSETMPELINNPTAHVSPKAALNFYDDLLYRKRDAEYIKSIDNAIDSSSELQNLSDIHAIVGIPVGAAGSSEANNIYSMLGNLYAEQDPETLKRSMVLLHVNWYDDALSDAEKRQNIEKTKAEIQRARADFPNLRIASFETVWEREKFKDTPIIGHVAKKLEDVTLRALKRAMDEGRLPEDRDVLLIRNDADAIGLHRNYLKNYMKAMKENPDIDIFNGTTTFDNTKANRVPEMVFAANFMQSLDLLAAAREKHVHTGGANFAVMSSIKAATGGMGFDLDDSGAGSDDLNNGRRISLVREGALGRTHQGGLGGYGRGLVQRYRSGSRPSNARKKKIAKRVVGARLDTDSDRSEGVFLRGVPMISTWDEGYDTNGYRPRTNESIDKLRQEYRAKVNADPEFAIEALRSDMEASLGAYKDYPSVMRVALDLAFHGIPDADQRHAAYKLTTSGEAVKLEFTDKGRAYIRDYIRQYNERKMRQMYGRNTTGNLVKTRPMMLKV